MGICLTGAVEGLCRRENCEIKVVTLPSGRVTSHGWQTDPALLGRQIVRSKQGLPITLTRVDKLGSGLLDGVLMAVMRCLRLAAPVSKHSQRH
jgi:hypothetical protein